MAVKKNVSVIAEELRVLNSVADDQDPAHLLDWLTPDFWTMVGTGVSNLVAVAAVLGWVDQSSLAGMTQAVVALVGAAQVIVLNSALVWKYLSGRQELRAQMLDSKYRYMESVAIEKLRIDRNA